MFAFLLDGICAQYVFLGMNWNSTPKEELSVYFHCRVLFELSFRGVYEKLTEHFFVVIFHVIFEIDPPYMTYQVKESLQFIADCFSAPEGTYIRFFGCQISPHRML